MVCNLYLLIKHLFDSFINNNCILHQVREDATPGVVIYTIAAEDPDVSTDEGLR